MTIGWILDTLKKKKDKIQLGLPTEWCGQEIKSACIHAISLGIQPLVFGDVIIVYYSTVGRENLKEGH